MLNTFIKGQELKIVGSLVVSDTIDYLEADFHFQTSDWDGASKWAHFSQGEKSFEILLTDDKIRKEDHLNLAAGEWKIYLHGTFPTGSRVTTEVKAITVKPTGLLDGEPLPEIPLPAAEQIAAQAQRAENTAKEALTEVKKVAPLAQNAKNAAEAAAKSAEAADRSAKSAGSAASSAVGAAGQAEAAKKTAETFAGQVEQDKGAVDQLVMDAQSVAANINKDVLKAGEIANQIGRDALAVSQNTQTVVNAKNEVNQAKNRIERLEQSAQNAKSAAETAAGNAQESETAASASAESAAGSATRAETAQGEADQSARAAAGSALAAQNAAGNAGTAAGKAETAQKAAETAQGKAEKAVAGIDTAVSNGIKAHNESPESHKPLFEKKADKKYIDQTFANAFVDHAVGEVIASDMVSPVEHDVGCLVESLNAVDWTDLPARKDTQTNKNVNITEGTYKISIYNQDGSEDGIPGYVFCAASMFGSTGEPIVRNLLSGTYITREQAEKVKYIGVYFAGTRYTGPDDTLKVMVGRSLEKLPYVPYVSDLSSVIVSRYGGNLFSQDKVKEMSSLKYDPATGIYTDTTADTNPEVSLKVQEYNAEGVYITGHPLKPKSIGKQVISFKKSAGTDYIRFANGGFEREFTLSYYVRDIPVGSMVRFSFDLMEKIPGAIKFRAVQISLLDIPETVFEKPQEIHPLPDGTVPGITSLSPNMTILSDTPGVLIQADYNLDGKKYVDKKFEELQSAILSQGANI